MEAEIKPEVKDEPPDGNNTGIQNVNRPNNGPSCKICILQFDSKEASLKHYSETHPHLFLCEICFEPFTEKETRDFHYQRHLGLNQTCRLCNMSFKNAEEVRNHNCQFIQSSNNPNDGMMKKLQMDNPVVPQRILHGSSVLKNAKAGNNEDVRKIPHAINQQAMYNNAGQSLNSSGSLKPMNAARKVNAARPPNANKAVKARGALHNTGKTLPYAIPKQNVGLILQQIKAQNVEKNELRNPNILKGHTPNILLKNLLNADNKVVGLNRKGNNKPKNQHIYNYEMGSNDNVRNSIPVTNTKRNEIGYNETFDYSIHSNNPNKVKDMNVGKTYQGDQHNFLNAKKHTNNTNRSTINKINFGINNPTQISKNGNNNRQNLNNSYDFNREFINNDHNKNQVSGKSQNHAIPNLVINRNQLTTAKKDIREIEIDPKMLGSKKIIKFKVLPKKVTPNTISATNVAANSSNFHQMPNVPQDYIVQNDYGVDNNAKQSLIINLNQDNDNRMTHSTSNPDQRFNVVSMTNPVQNDINNLTAEDIVNLPILQTDFNIVQPNFQNNPYSNTNINQYGGIIPYADMNARNQDYRHPVIQYAPRANPGYPNYYNDPNFYNQNYFNQFAPNGNGRMYMNPTATIVSQDFVRDNYNLGNNDAPNIDMHENRQYNSTVDNRVVQPLGYPLPFMYQNYPIRNDAPYDMYNQRMDLVKLNDRCMESEEVVIEAADGTLKTGRVVKRLGPSESNQAVKEPAQRHQAPRKLVSAELCIMDGNKESGAKNADKNLENKTEGEDSKPNNKVFYCSICNQFFCTKTIFDDHTKVHNNIQLCPCNICDRSLKPTIKKPVTDASRLISDSYDLTKIDNSSDIDIDDLNSPIRSNKNHTNLTNDKIDIKKETEKTKSDSSDDVIDLTEDDFKPAPKQSKDTFVNNCQPDSTVQSEMYSCKNCGKDFRKKPSYLNHLQRCMSNETYSCYICSLVLSSLPSLQRHQKICYDKSVLKFSCDQCDEKFPEMHILQYHQKTHENKCEVCEKTFATREGVRRHSRVHTGERPEKCQYCELDYKNRTNLFCHIEMQHSHRLSKDFTCDKCGGRFINKSRLKTHVNTICSQDNIKKNPFQCHFCKFRVPNDSKLSKHIARNHIQKFVCDVCKKSFGNKKRIIAHIAKCHQPKDFECIVCKKKYPLISQLHLHERVHFNSHKYRYNCTKCKKRFLHYSTFTYHTKRSNCSSKVTKTKKIKPKSPEITCDYCRLVFRKPHQLYRHKKFECTELSTGQDWLVCPYCEKIYWQKCQLNTHIAKTHTHMFKCKVCLLTFSSEEELDVHKECHGDVLE